MRNDPADRNDCSYQLQFFKALVKSKCTTHQGTIFRWSLQDHITHDASGCYDALENLAEFSEKCLSMPK